MNDWINLQIGGMTCASCELVLERKIKKIPGVEKVHVNHRNGLARIRLNPSDEAALAEIQTAIEEAGYSLGENSVALLEPDQKWLEISSFLLIIFGLYKIFQGLDLVSLTSAGSDTATFAGILLIGLVAGTSSCLAVTGGLLLSMAAKYNEVHGGASRWQKFKPLLMFNLGRLSSYFVLGGLVGILGQSITLSTQMTGYMNIVIALVMFYLALTLLKIIPKGSFPIRPPKWLSHKIANLSEHEHPAAPFALGALTFFLPCGFTQSLQLVALASGSFITGALTMFTFALGTLPALLGISAISASAKGRTSRLFIRFSGTLVLVLSLFNLNSGLILTGTDVTNLFGGRSEASTSESIAAVTQTEEGQTINMTVTSYNYSPDSFTIQAGKPTTIIANVDKNLGGCISVLTVPDFGLSVVLKPGENKLGPFTPTKDFFITCPMGMFSAKVNVTN
jgi:sulfite exporter TauE/SafE/copper chaperone CopZ